MPFFFFHSFFYGFHFFLFQLEFQTHVIFPHLAVSNSDEYFPEPKRFLPERWIKRGELSMRNSYNHYRMDSVVHLLMKCQNVIKSTGDVSNCPHAGQKIHPFVSLPFGYGRRMCIGRRFAENELHILVAKVIKEFFFRENETKP